MARKHDRSTVLITGAAGFCGSHLVESLVNQGLRVVGVDVAGAPTRNLQRIYDRIEYIRVDLRDEGQCRRVLGEIRPDYIFHLAALTTWIPGENYQALYAANVFGTVNLLEAMLAEKLTCPVLISGSSAQYGLADPEASPIQETQPFHPITHYGVSKVAQDMVAYQYWKSAGLRVIRTRTFNILGPRQSPRFVGSAFARQIAEIELGRREPLLHVGNLEARRDFIDVRDVTTAYWLATQHGAAGEIFNVSTGKARSIRSLLEKLLQYSAVPDIQVCRDETRVQIADIPTQAGDPSKLTDRTGWKATISFDQTAHDLLDYWRAELNLGDEP